MAGWRNWFRRTAAQDRYVENWLRGVEDMAATVSGIAITPDVAMGVPAIAACVQVLSEDLAKVPLELKRRVGDGFEPATDHPLYRLLKFGPSDWLSGYAWRSAMAATMLTRGNHYSRVHRRGGMVSRITMLPEGSVAPAWTREGEPFYDLRLSGEETERLAFYDVVHSAYRHAPVYDSGGVIGVSPIIQNRDSVALMVAAERFAGFFYRNGMKPSMVLEYDRKLPDEATASRIRERVEAAYSGVSNSFRVAILEYGIKLKEITTDPQRSQLIETRKFAAEQACTMFRVPPHKIGILERATNNNIEHQSIDYVTGPISALAKMVESAIAIACLSPEERMIYKVEHNLEGLMRGDVLARYRAYAIGRQWGWLSVNDIRKSENANGIGADGDEYLSPLNMAPSGGMANDETTDAMNGTRPFNGEAIVRH